MLKPQKMTLESGLIANGNQNRSAKIIAIIAISMCLILGVSYGISIILQKNVDSFFVQKIQMQEKASSINNAIKQRIKWEVNGFVPTTDDLMQQDGLLEEFIILTNELVLNIPKQLDNLLDDDVKYYIIDTINNLNECLQQAKQEIESEYLKQQEKIIQSSILRGFQFEAFWIQASIDFAFVAVNVCLSAAKAVAWLTGKKAVVKVVKEAVVGILKFVVTLAPSFAGVVATLTNGLQNASEEIFFRWFSIGGIVANFIDMVDNDGLNGWITFN